MTETLTSIWQRVLQRSSIGADDNFFDLGGDPSLATELFAEIAKAYGRELPPVMIYCAPTIATLAALLEQPSAPLFPPLVLLKAGTEKPPVFIAHGLGGSVMMFSELVKHIRSPHAIHGMQARGIDGVSQPFERIEDMAEFHLDAIKELQPHGPYILIGFSLGGLVALEIAQRLSRSGEKIALLAMLETYPHPRYVPLGQRSRLIVRRAKYHASSVMRMPIGQALSYVTQRVRCRLRVPGDGKASARYLPPVGTPVPPVVQSMRDAGYLALKRYRPRFYRGKIKFVKAEDSPYFPDDPAAVWTRLAEEFEVETAPGDHDGIVTTYFKSLASILSRYLQEAS